MTSTAFSTTTSKPQAARRFQFVLFVAATLSIALLANAQGEQPRARIEALSRATSLRGADVHPWELKLSFVLNDVLGRKQDEGTIDVKWWSPRKESIRVDSHLLQAELGPTLSDDARLAREEFLVRQLVAETVSPVAVPQSEFEVKERDQKFGSVTLLCLTVIPKGVTDPSRASVYCVDKDKPAILRARQEDVEGALRNKLAIFQEKSVALENKILFGRVVAITGSVNTLAAIQEEPDQVNGGNAVTDPMPLPGDVVAGQKIAGESPRYPTMALQSHTSGVVVLAADIDTTGHLAHLVPIASSDGLLTQASIQAVKTWQYKPFLLQGKPTSVQTGITLHFNLY